MITEITGLQKLQLQMFTGLEIKRLQKLRDYSGFTGTI